VLPLSLSSFDAFQKEEKEKKERKREKKRKERKEKREERRIFEEQRIVKKNTNPIRNINPSLLSNKLQDTAVGGGLFIWIPQLKQHGIHDVQAR
jgi:ribosomal protein S4